MIREDMLIMSHEREKFLCDALRKKKLIRNLVYLRYILNLFNAQTK